MPRPSKQCVDYFPHYSDSSRKSDTIEALENYCGNDGYAFWFKLLEMLSSADGLYIDCNKPGQWVRLLSRMRMDDEHANRCIQILVELESISREHWEKAHIIWCPNLAEHVQKVFAKRGKTVRPPHIPIASEEPDAKGSGKYEVVESAFGDVVMDEVIIAVQKELYGLTDRQYVDLEAYREDVGDELVLYAIDEAVAHGTRTWAYVAKILDDLKKKNIKSVGEAKTAKGNDKPKALKQEADPDPVRWFG